MATIEPKTAQSAVAITPDDDLEYTPILDAVYVGGAGNLVVEDGEGTEITFVVLAGFILPMSVSRVLETSTATSLVGFRY